MGHFSRCSCGVASYSQAPRPRCPECGRTLTDGELCSADALAGRTVRLHGRALAPSEARAMIDSWSDGIDGSLLYTVKLLASELVTNRIALTGCSSIGLVLAVRDGRIRVTVSDHGDPGAAPNGDGGGRAADWGLHLLEGLADRWDVEDGDLPQVWFEIDRHRRAGGVSSRPTAARAHGDRAWRRRAAPAATLRGAH
jgi:hypothetical protein